jgi:hypothetical protein
VSASLQLDEGAGGFAPARVGLGHYGRDQHLGVAVEHVLDLDGRDVLAARNDDVLAAVLDLEIAVRVLHGQVARCGTSRQRRLPAVAVGFFR